MSQEWASFSRPWLPTMSNRAAATSFPSANPHASSSLNPAFAPMMSTRPLSPFTPPPKAETRPVQFPYNGIFAPKMSTVSLPAASPLDVRERDLPSWLVSSARSAERNAEVVPQELALAADKTRKKVAQAVASAFGKEVAGYHEALFVGFDFRVHAPFPRLSLAAKTLLKIWNTAQHVTTNGIDCFNLIQRCADTLLSVYTELHKVEDRFWDELAAAFTKLEDTFTHIFRFVLKQTRSFLLSRELDVMIDISACDLMLGDVVAMFSWAIRYCTSREKRDRRPEVLPVPNATLAADVPPETSDATTVVDSAIPTQEQIPSAISPSRDFSGTMPSNPAEAHSTYAPPNPTNDISHLSPPDSENASIYSYPSSRTVSTDYGFFYRRMALSPE